METEIGRFAISTAGHDKGKMYLIVGYQNGRYLLADGKIRTLDKPKEKKEKHLQLIHAQDKMPEGILNGKKPVRNEDIKRALKLFKAMVPPSRRYRDV